MMSVKLASIPSLIIVFPSLASICFTRFNFIKIRSAIRPNENLIFDVEIVEVKDAPPRQQMPGMPPGQNPNR